MGQKEIPPKKRLTRKVFLAGGAAIVGGGLAASLARLASSREENSEIGGSIIGPSYQFAHRLRHNGFPVPSRTEKTRIAILGGGIAGLSAGWKLNGAGLTDFRVIELEPHMGGNAAYGESAGAAYPWGAHYLPFPGPRAKAVSELLRELGVEKSRDAAGRPVYDPRYVCFAPQERLFIHGRWNKELFPELGADREDLRQRNAFEAEMERYRRLRGRDGRPAFTIPMELSSRDPGLLELDKISMAVYLKNKGWNSPRLRWYVDYACRDDFGSVLGNASAWAGIHYYASRGTGAAGQVLTWPEGNGWIVRRLAARIKGRLRSRSLVYRIEEVKGGVEVDYFDAGSGRAVRLKARAAVVCLPQYAAARVIPALAKRRKAGWAFQYAPWMVANLFVENPPAGQGTAPAWDNVIYDSDALGYVDSTHQSLSQDRRRAVWTYYQPFPSGDPAANRKKLLATSWDKWRDRILSDLEHGVAGLRSRVRKIDVMLWGHGMIRPSVGFIWGGKREAAAKSIGRIFFGHSDLSGFSLFEEAQYRGLRAAEAAMRRLGHTFKSSL